MKIYDLFDIEKTIAKGIFVGVEYPWEILAHIQKFILQIGSELPLEKFDHPQEDVWIAKNAKVFPTAYIAGPCIIDQEAEIRHCAFIRGNAIVGKKCVVGNSTELKNVILFDEVQVPHYNYVGDSILGYHAHMGAGSITSNLKSDKSLVRIKTEDGFLETNQRKVGAFIGDAVDVGCNSVLCPGTIIGRNTTIYPLSRIRGTIPENSIYKNEGKIITKK